MYTHGLFLYLLLKKPDMTACPTIFPPTFLPPLFRVKIKKKSHFQLVFDPVISYVFSSIGYNCYVIVLWLEIHGVFFRFFLLFGTVTSAVTTYSVGFFKPTAHDLSNSS